MRSLNRQDMRDLLLGCAILGSGGGGSPEQGLAIVDAVFRREARFDIVGIDEVSSDALVGCPYLLGSVTSEVEESVPFFLNAVLEAYRVMEEHLGATLDAAFPTELGALNTALGMAAPALAGRPSIDGDPAGRAVPEIQHTAMAVNGLPITPLCVSDGYGGSVVVARISHDVLAEHIIRGVAAQSPHGAVGVVDHVIQARDLRRAVIPGTLTQALQLGRTYSAAGESRQAIQAVADASGGRILFRGRVESVEARTEGGFTLGTIELVGGEAFERSKCRVWFKNENLAAWRDGVVLASAPDIISVIDEEAGSPVMNPACTVGVDVAVVVIPAPDLWTTPRGIELFGPRSLGLDFDYTPVVPLEASPSGL